MYVSTQHNCIRPFAFCKLLASVTKCSIRIPAIPFCLLPNNRNDITVLTRRIQRGYVGLQTNMMQSTTYHFTLFFLSLLFPFFLSHIFPTATNSWSFFVFWDVFSTIRYFWSRNYRGNYVLCFLVSLENRYLALFNFYSYSSFLPLLSMYFMILLIKNMPIVIMIIGIIIL